MNKTMKTILAATTLTISMASSAMEFKMTNFANSDDPYIQMTGDIVIGDAVKFKEFIEANKSSGAKVVSLYSGGGNVDESEKLAMIIRDNEFTTIANKYCASACVSVFSGGVERAVILDDKGRSLGFHLSSSQDYDDKSKEEWFWLGQYSNSEDMIFYIEMLGNKDTHHLIETIKNGYTYAYSRENKMYWPKNFELIKTGLITMEWN